MDPLDQSGSYDIKGGKTFLGKLFTYQEKTGMTPKQIMNISYIQFVLGMLDAPSIDYESKKKKKNTDSIAKTKEDQKNAIFAGLG